ncbi:putative RNA recognition motif domain, DnaJ domain, RNA-binding domain superfamily [Helianthus annuus]|nr:putative RNA recognition motif domain, DnaJ domain, RNA-binding domain superfamily [Helianthus annuus]KAJ0883614.1 putative RNA recognition motif domain, DnaJ domain, RNA-binding domain superfamily [Helianthus annuus]
MDEDIDHYVILGLPSGEEGFKLSEKEITKAYRLKALELHPDKRPDDPNAPANFQKLQTSYQVLKDEKARKLFHDLLRVKQQKLQRQSQQDSKRRRMMSDLEERERSAFAAHDASAKATSEEESIARKLKEEISRIRAMHANNKSTPTVTATMKKQSGVGETSNTGPTAAEKEKMLKVSWEKGGLDYSAQRLRELFETFGEVKDVVIRSQKKKGSALVVMATKEAAMAATGTMCGDISNPLLVVPLQPAVATSFPMAREPVVPQRNEELVGAGYQAFEDSVLQKLQKAAERQKQGYKP